jgi:YD repeat-containing protein
VLSAPSADRRRAFRYDTSGNLLYVKSTTGYRHSLTYDAGGRIKYITAPGSRRLSYTYDISNKIRRLQDASGRITTGNVKVKRLTSRSNAYGNERRGRIRMPGEHECLVSREVFPGSKWI